jgi:GT2 family glycosyltransferase
MFDPDFFMYSEEVELCYRINKKYKYTIEISPEINIIHKNGGSTSDRSWANKQSYLSSALLFFKIRGHFGYLLYHCLILINVFTNFFAMWLLNKAYRKDYWKDLSYYFYSCKQYILLPLKYKRKIGSGKNLLQIIQ